MAAINPKIVQTGTASNNGLQSIDAGLKLPVK